MTNRMVAIFAGGILLAACATPTAPPPPTNAPINTVAPPPATPVPPTAVPTSLPTASPATSTSQPQATALSIPTGVPTLAATAVPTAAPRIVQVPEVIAIANIKLNAPIERAKIGRDRATGQIGWQVPDGPLVGWHDDSSKLGESGNIVLSGHHNIEGKIYGRLNELVGDPSRVCSQSVDGSAKNLPAGVQVTVRSANYEAVYELTDCKLLLQRGVKLAELQQHGRLIQPGGENRITLVTCWPAWDNSHRLVLVAKQVSIKSL